MVRSFIFFTAFWGLVGIVLGQFIPNGPNKGVIQISLSLSAACCYLIWLSAWLAQLNPLFGPQLNDHALHMMEKQKF